MKLLAPLRWVVRVISVRILALLEVVGLPRIPNDDGSKDTEQ